MLISFSQLVKVAFVLSTQAYPTVEKYVIPIHNLTEALLMMAVKADCSHLLLMLTKYVLLFVTLPILKH